VANVVDCVCGECGSSDVVYLKYTNCSEIFCKLCKKITKIVPATLRSVESLPDYCFKSRLIKDKVPISWYCKKRDHFQFRDVGFVFDKNFGWECVCGEWICGEDPNHAVIEFGERWVLPHV